MIRSNFSSIFLYALDNMMQDHAWMKENVERVFESYDFASGIVHTSNLVTTFLEQSPNPFKHSEVNKEFVEMKVEDTPTASGQMAPTGECRLLFCVRLMVSCSNPVPMTAFTRTFCIM